VGLGAGALYLATRGKAKPKTKVIERVVRLKPKQPSTGMKTPSGPTHPIPSGPPAPVRVQAKANHGTASTKPKGEQRDDLAREAPKGTKYDKTLVERSPDEPVTPTDQLKAMVDKDAEAAKARRAVQRAKAQMHGKQGNNPRQHPLDKTVGKADYDILANRAKMDIVDELVFKALTGEKGDKRNTKYALIGGAGYMVGANTGDRVGARMAGTTIHENRAKIANKMADFVANEKSQLPPEKRAKYMVSLKDMTKVGNSVKGTRQIVRGSAIGSGVGAATAAGMYAIYRNDKKRRLVSKKDKGMDAKKGALLGAGAGMAAGNVVGIPAAGMAAAMSGKKSSSKTFVRSLTRFNRSALVLVPAGLGAGLGALAGKGAKDTRQKLSKAEVQMLAKREAMALL
jgi:hypothetical protein